MEPAPAHDAGRCRGLTEHAGRAIELLPLLAHVAGFALAACTDEVAILTDAAPDAAWASMLGGAASLMAAQSGVRLSVHTLDEFGTGVTAPVGLAAAGTAEDFARALRLVLDADWRRLLPSVVVIGGASPGLRDVASRPAGSTPRRNRSVAWRDATHGRASDVLPVVTVSVTDHAWADVEILAGFAGPPPPTVPRAGRR